MVPSSASSVACSSRVVVASAVLKSTTENDPSWWIRTSNAAIRLPERPKQ